MNLQTRQKIRKITDGVEEMTKMETPRGKGRNPPSKTDTFQSAWMEEEQSREIFERDRHRRRKLQSSTKHNHLAEPGPNQFDQ